MGRRAPESLTRSRSVSVPSQPAPAPTVAGTAWRRTVRSTATVCLQLVPTGQEQEPAQTGRGSSEELQ